MVGERQGLETSAGSRGDPYRLDWTDWVSAPGRGGKCELLDGELVLSPAPSALHQTVRARIAERLDDYLEATRRGVRFGGSTAVRLGLHNVVQPDLYVCRFETFGRMAAPEIAALPDLVIEILDRGSVRNDTERKAWIYSRYLVLEYWIFDPMRRRVTRLRPAVSGDELDRLFGPGEEVRSRHFPGLAIRLDEVIPTLG